MNFSHLLGSALLAAGAILLLIGATAGASPIEQLYASLAPVYAPAAEWYLISGLTAAATGLLLALSPGR